MTWTLGIDTSHHVAVGLARDGVAVDAFVVPDTRAHGETLMPSIVELTGRHGLRVAEVDEFAVGMGPGPFTGLRVGVVAALTLAHLAGREAHRVCSLDVLAAEWRDAPAEFIIVSDARRKELYWGHYVDGVRVGEPRVGKPSELPELPMAGVVPDSYLDVVTPDPTGPTALDAAVLAARWAELPVAGKEPYYLRPADASIVGPPKSALPRLRVPR